MLKVIEVATDISSPGATGVAVQKVLNTLPQSTKFLGSCANASSVLLFLDDGKGPAASPTPPAPPPAPTTPASP